MSFFLVTASNGLRHLRQSSRLEVARAKAAKEFPSGVASVSMMGPQELQAWQTAGYPLPPAARVIVDRWKASARAAVAVERRVNAVRQRARARVEKAREEARALIEAERQKMKDDAAAEKRRDAAMEKRAAKRAMDAVDQEAIQRAALRALPNDDRFPDVAPWD